LFGGIEIFKFAAFFFEVTGVTSYLGYKLVTVLMSLRREPWLEAILQKIVSGMLCCFGPDFFGSLFYAFF